MILLRINSAHCLDRRAITLSSTIRLGLTADASGLALKMLRLTKKADYSLIALRHFALRQERTGGAVSAKEVSDSCGIPLPVLSKLLQKLGKSGFLVSEYGTNGGYKLAREAQHISALEVIRAIDGPIVLANCFTEHAVCGHSDKCTVKKPLRRIHEGILRLLDSVSIQDMLRDSEPKPDFPLPGSSLVALQSGGGPRDRKDL